MSPRTTLCGLAVIAVAATASGQGTPIDLSSWSVVQYEFNSQPDANWVLQAGNTAALQTVNSDPSIFLGDFDAVGLQLNGSWRVDSASDDDFMGFVFGYQGRGQYYLFDWKKANQDVAAVGMSLKIVHMPAGQDPTSGDLWPTAGSANVSTVRHNSIPWVTAVNYGFELLYSAGNIGITVRQGSNVLEHWTLADATYTSGKFGFYNYSQDFVRYEGFTQQDVISYYCTAKLNSQGCLPVLNTTGFPSLSDSTPFHVSASLLVNQMNADLFLSRTGSAALPFNGGFLCLSAPLIATPLIVTGGSTQGFDCTGSLTLDVNALLQSGGVPGVVAGDTLHAQCIYRDKPLPDGTGMTLGVEFVVQP